MTPLGCPQCCNNFNVTNICVTSICRSSRNSNNPKKRKLTDYWGKLQFCCFSTTRESKPVRSPGKVATRRA